MIEYSTLIAVTSRHLAVSDTAAVRAGIEAVLGAVDQVLDADARGRLAAELPGTLRPTMATATATRTMTTAEFLDVVAALGSYPPERARYWAQGVLAGLAEVDPAAAEIVRPALPDPDLMLPLGQRPAPVSSGVATRRSPDMLEPEELERALAGLTGWTGDTTRITRTVDVAAERVQPLIEAVHRIESEVDHHARIDQGPDGLGFTVWTHTLNRVTDLDLELARRIDEAVDSVASD